MNLLLKSAVIVDSASPYHLQELDIWIRDGLIKELGKDIKVTDTTEVRTLHNLHVSSGWFDSSVSFGEPGYEERETLSHGLQVAATSGFTGIAVQPQTCPVIDTNVAVAFLKAQGVATPVTLYPIGALTKKSEGKDLAELFDMHQSGAIAFGDYKKPIENPNLLKIALLYAQNFDGIVMSFPQDMTIAGDGAVHEHIQSTALGLKGIPVLAETLRISRDLYLLEYTGGCLHIPTISTAASVALIRDAKAKGLKVSCSVAVHNLLLTDAELIEFDTRYKVLPPLRNTEDCVALIEGVKDGTIDMVTSDHTPVDIEHKKMEFEHALYGTVGLESLFGVLNKLVGKERAVYLLTAGRSFFGVKSTTIEIGGVADLTLFDPDTKYQFEQSHILSTAKNSAFLGQSLKGTVYGIVAKNQCLIKE